MSRNDVRFLSSSECQPLAQSGIGHRGPARPPRSNVSPDASAEREQSAHAQKRCHAAASNPRRSIPRETLTPVPAGIVAAVSIDRAHRFSKTPRLSVILIAERASKATPIADRS